MPRTVESEPLKKKILNLYEGDWEKLQGYYPKTSTGVVIRRIVREHIKRIEATTAPIDLDIGDSL